MERRGTPAHYMPSARQVAAMCQQIQASWTPKERARRAVRKSGRWSPPQVHLADIGLANERRSSVE